MLYSFFSRLIIGALLVALTGCSALRLGYGQGPTLAYWWMDRYLDFDSTQSLRVREGLDELFRWHRTTQLNDLAQLLARAQVQALEPATPAQVCRWADDLAARLNLAYDHVLPVMAEVTLSLKPAQLQHLAQRYERANEEFKDDFLQATPDERLQASVKRAVERAEFFYGRLEDKQMAVLTRGVAASPFDAQAWLAERQARQQDVLSSLRRWTAEKASPEAVRAGLKSLGQRAQRSGRDNYRGYQQRLLDYNCSFAAELHNATTPVQRQRAAQKLKGWEEDLRALAADAAAP